MTFNTKIRPLKNSTRKKKKKALFGVFRQSVFSHGMYFDLIFWTSTPKSCRILIKQQKKEDSSGASPIMTHYISARQINTKSSPKRACFWPSIFFHGAVFWCRKKNQLFDPPKIESLSPKKHVQFHFLKVKT